MGPHGVREADEARLAAELRVDRAVVDDVVAVGRARPRLLQGRGVDVADPEPRQVGHDRLRVREGEVLVELQPVGGAGRRRGEPGGARARAPILAESEAASFASGPPGAAMESRSRSSLRRQFG